MDEEHRDLLKESSIDYDETFLTCSTEIIESCKSNCKNEDFVKEISNLIKDKEKTHHALNYNTTRLGNKKYIAHTQSQLLKTPFKISFNFDESQKAIELGIIEIEKKKKYDRHMKKNKDKSFSKDLKER